MKTWKPLLAWVSALLMAREGIIPYRKDHEHCDTVRHFQSTNESVRREIRPGGSITGEIDVTLPFLAGAGYVPTKTPWFNYPALFYVDGATE